MANIANLVRWFENIGLEDVSAVGGKNASLGELYRELRAEGVRVPNGFALTVQPYFDAVKLPSVRKALHDRLDDLDVANVELLAKRASEARSIVFEATGTEAMREAVATAYRKLQSQYGADVAVAVRSSATAEDLPAASFAGQHESYLNIFGAGDLFEACRLCFASLFTDRAIVYRANNGFDHFKVGLSVGVMKMVRSDAATSGVIFTLDTESGFRDVVFITGSYGLGENIVQGKIDPDEYLVHKPAFRAGYRCVLRRKLGEKELSMTLTKGHVGSTTKNVPTPADKQSQFCLTDEEALTLAGYALKIEAHYSARAGHAMPMDIEWAKDGVDGLLYIVQARPETVASQKSLNAIETYTLRGSGKVLVSGKAVGERIGAGIVRVVGAAE